MTYQNAITLLVLGGLVTNAIILPMLWRIRHGLNDDGPGKPIVDVVFATIGLMCLLFLTLLLRALQLIPTDATLTQPINLTLAVLFMVNPLVFALRMWRWDQEQWDQQQNGPDAPPSSKEVH